ncbi:MAG: deoxyribose-phosphate aldolase [Candidatus Euphemobacter frigidus]|nr:deoxyribose-phosphate aldolase [Candidatus Euphemobacter frigidus]MDP8276292.1 deoxyribose-phosphate aldolase [Candidatus Euphemobacter frigidus]
MDTQALIERVTKEVMAALEGDAPSALSASACAVENGASCLECGQCVTNRPGLINALILNGVCRISTQLGIGEVEAKIAHMIDHTLLKPEATEDQIRQLCREASTYCFASVCINPVWIELSAKLLRRSGVNVCTVIGFPLGADTSETKAYETRDAIAKGATEIDMVINVGLIKSRQYRRVEEDIRGVVRATRPNILVKVILETCLLTDEEKVKACELSVEAGADFVKTSTGFSTGGATVEDIALMRKVVGPEIGVKASGGVRSFDDAQAMVQAGATRLGASASLKIIRVKDAGGSSGIK